MLRFFNALKCFCGKSAPTTATTRTGEKKLAAYEKYVADPPRTSAAWPNGVLMVSSAMEPTTSMDMGTGPERQSPGGVSVYHISLNLLRRGLEITPEFHAHLLSVSLRIYETVKRLLENQNGVLLYSARRI